MPGLAATMPPPAPGAGLTPALATAGGETAIAPAAMDAIMAAIEDRVMAEIERRGGRYQGLF
ncbi:MAG TPA: hypothetical protein VHL53_08740 [Acidimicrobiia bacterium]|nr:hypothetical protein [Acidimicrobiia bacterium]